MAELSTAAIICLSVAGYTVLVLVLLVIRYFLMRRGMCTCAGCNNICGEEAAPHCSSCCVSMTETCSCGAPSINGCLNSCCPNKKTVGCVDLLLCQCCLGEDNCFTKWCNQAGTLASQNAP